MFKDEDELRALWRRPDTRKALLEGLADKGFGMEQLAEAGKIIEAQNSDLYDVLAYIAFALPPITRNERVKAREKEIYKRYDFKQKEFLEFMLDHYVAHGVGKLDTAKLPQLVELKYHSLGDAVAELGTPENINQVFVEFQRHLY